MNQGAASELGLHGMKNSLRQFHCAPSRVSDGSVDARVKTGQRLP